MATVQVQPDAVPPLIGDQADARESSVLRFGLRRLFEALTYTAIAAWALRSSSTSYEIHGYPPWATVFFGVTVGAIVALVLLPVLRIQTIVRLAMIALVAYALNQTVLSRRLAALRGEIESIIAYVDAHKLQHGLYPADLTGYQFNRPELAEYIEYRDAFPTTSYEIRWHPTHAQAISHWYGSDYGHYFEDD
jgi:hypothetical protein